MADTEAHGLPRTFRPRWARRVVYPAAVALFAVFAAGAVVLPGGQAGFGVGDRVGMVLIGLAVAWFLHRLAAVRLVCTESGVWVVNIFRSRRLEWAEILGVRLEPSAPWLTLDVSDGTTLAAMGIQGSDGNHARAQARELADMVAERTRTSRDD